MFLNYHAEQTVILNEITQDRKKVMEYDRNKTFKFHRLEKSTEESVSTLQSVVETDQHIGVPHKKRPLTEYKNPSSMLNTEYV